LESLGRSRLVVPLALLVAAALIAWSELGYRRAHDALAADTKVLSARIEVRRLQLLMLTAETNLRGHVLTEQVEFLEPYRRAVDAMPRQLDLVRSIYASEAGRQPQIAEIVKLTEQRLAHLALQEQAMANGRREAAIDLSRTGLGREYMRALEQLISTLAGAEQLRMEANRTQLERTLDLHRFGIAGLVLFALAAAVFTVRASQRVDLERARRQRDLQAERDRLEEQVRLRTQELYEIASHLQRVREDERAHLARELHDELGGLLTAAKLDVARMRARLRDAGPEVGERLAHLVGTLDAGIALKRRIIEDLRPSTLTNLGLAAALGVLCRDFEARSDVPVVLAVEELRLGDDGDLTVFRLVQEALTNIGKYAKATRVSVSLQRAGDEAVVRVVDDGIGFDPELTPPRVHGLAGMRFRLGSIGGRFVLKTRPGEGTTVEGHLRLPSTAP
jgi:signal transduction histidine kinase